MTIIRRHTSRLSSSIRESWAEARRIWSLPHDDLWS